MHRISEEMEELFLIREDFHRSLVRKNILKMQGYFGLTLNQLSEAADLHDISKFKEPERSAYSWMTWMYHCKNNDLVFQYPLEVEATVKQGWLHHVSNNSHHPEAHANPNAMPILDIVEMVCDWTAISQEQNGYNSSCIEWAIENIDKKWKFSLAKKDFIFSTIKELDARNNNHF